MIKKSIFTVIIPVKGRLNFTQEAINSIYKQEYIENSSVEIIVVENEKGREVIRDKIIKLYPRVKIVINKFEDYAGGNRNSGLKVAHGKYIVFLDSDDQLDSNFLYESSKILDKDKKCSASVCFSRAIFTPEYKLLERIKWFFLMIVRDVSLLFFFLFNHKYLLHSAFYLCQLSHMMFKKELIKELSFDYQYFRGGEDWDFINRLQNKGPIRIIPRLLTIFRYSYYSSTILPINKRMKWNSYLKLANKLSPARKRSIYYKLFLQYIDLFRVKTY